MPDSILFGFGLLGSDCFNSFTLYSSFVFYDTSHFGASSWHDLRYSGSSFKGCLLSLTLVSTL